MHAVDEGAAFLCAKLGTPALGILCGSGFGKLAGVLGSGGSVLYEAIPGFPAPSARGSACCVTAARVRGACVWVFERRLHIYERLNAMEAAYPVALLAAAGAQSVVLTCAAGGLLESDRPGEFAIVTDHINLLGDDPLRHIPAESREPAFLDLQHVYDPKMAEAWRRAAQTAGVPLRDGVLAALPGPSYETPAEVRMLRTLGADLASMSVVPEAILAAYRRVRVAAIACISNRGAGVGGLGAIEHGQVQDVVERAAAASTSFFRDGLSAMLF